MRIENKNSTDEPNPRPEWKNLANLHSWEEVQIVIISLEEEMSKAQKSREKRVLNKYIKILTFMALIKNTHQRELGWKRDQYHKSHMRSFPKR